MECQVQAGAVVCVSNEQRDFEGTVAVEVRKEIKGIAEMSPRDPSKTRREEKRISDIRFSFLNRVNCCYFPGRGRKRLDAFNRITRSLVILNDFLGSIFLFYLFEFVLGWKGRKFSAGY